MRAHFGTALSVEKDPPRLRLWGLTWRTRFIGFLVVQPKSWGGYLWRYDKGDAA